MTTVYHRPGDQQVRCQNPYCPSARYGRPALICIVEAPARHAAHRADALPPLQVVSGEFSYPKRKARHNRSVASGSLRRGLHGRDHRVGGRQHPPAVHQKDRRHAVARVAGDLVVGVESPGRASARPRSGRSARCRAPVRRPPARRLRGDRSFGRRLPCRRRARPRRRPGRPRTRPRSQRTRSGCAAADAGTRSAPAPVLTTSSMMRGSDRAAKR